MKKLIFIFVICFTTIVIYTNNAKADDFSDAMMDAKKELTGAMNSMSKSDALKVRGQFERILQLKQDEWLVNYYIALCDYMIALSEMSGGSADISEEGKKSIQKYTESGMEIINSVIQKKSDFSDGYVLKKFLNFNRWSYEQDKMNDIISVDQQVTPKAEQYGAKNPRYYLSVGISSYWTPEAFGGGPGRAIDMLKKANELYISSKPENDLYPEWGHDWSIGYEVLALLKRGDDGDKESAKTILDEGIQKYPDSGFLVSYVKSEYDKSLKEN